MTLIEALAVIVILGLLAGAVTALARHAMAASNISRARAQLGELADGLDRYALRFGHYPLDANTEVDATNLWTVIEDLPGGSPYVFRDQLPSDFAEPAAWIDPWKRPYRYRRVARPGDQDDEETCDVFSLGPDPELPDDDIRLTH